MPISYDKGLRDSVKSPDLIKSIETFRVKPRWLFVRVETEAGIVGWGEGEYAIPCHIRALNMRC